MSESQFLLHEIEEYKRLVPRASEAQKQSLKESMQQFGQLESIKVNMSGGILDGYTRFEFCNLLHLVPKYEIKRFKTEEEERSYVITTNLRRRQLSTYQQIILLEKERENFLKQSKESRKKLLSKYQNGEEPLTKEQRIYNTTNFKIGEIVGVSQNTVAQAYYIKKHATQDELNEVETAKIGIESMFHKIKRRLEGKKESNRNDELVTTTCTRCNSSCKKSKNCHVHKTICCIKCSWGI